MVYVTTPTSAYTNFNQSLSGNVGSILTWTLNIQDVRTSPSGFALGNYGAAYILGATNSTFTGAGSGNGYAVTIGNTASPDPIRLVKFTGGLSAPLTTIVTAPGQDAKADYWSVKVTYDPATDGWELFTRDDGTVAFADPATGVLTSSGVATDSTYTSVPLTHSGVLWAYSTAANQPSRYDNFTLLMDVPEPAMLPLSVLALALTRRRRSASIRGRSGSSAAAPVSGASETCCRRSASG